jgi:hypothetical protein
MTVPVLDAVVIEPDGNLAAALADILESWGLHTAAFATHAAAATYATGRGSISLLAACVPTSDDDREGAYLAEARAGQGGLLPTVLMLSDNIGADGREPGSAVSVSKPFTSGEFRSAVAEAGAVMPKAFTVLRPQ